MESREQRSLYLWLKAYMREWSYFHCILLNITKEFNSGPKSGKIRHPLDYECVLRDVWCVCAGSSYSMSLCSLHISAVSSGTACCLLLHSRLNHWPMHRPQTGWSHLLFLFLSPSPHVCVCTCVYLSLKVKPTILDSELATVDVQPYLSGKQHQLTCTAYGFPLPNITWLWQPCNSNLTLKQ